MGGVRGKEDEVESSEEEVDGGSELGFLVEDSSSRSCDGQGGGGGDVGGGGFLKSRIEGEGGDETVEIGDEVVEIDVEGFSCKRRMTRRVEVSGRDLE